MQRLGKNLGRYHGESIDIDRVQEEADRLAQAKGWARETFLDLPEIKLRGYRRVHAGSNQHFYFSTGIHGDEPSGPLAILELLASNEWPEANLYLVPCLNPTGFRLNTRENAAGLDLNRDYRHFRTREAKAHTAWLETLPEFDHTVVLHEDWEANGFYIYELNPENRPSLAEAVIEQMRHSFPIEHADLVDNWPQKDGIIRPNVKPEDRPEWAEALYLIVNKTRQSCTFEAPSDFPLEFRVKMQLRAMRSAFEFLRQS